MKGSIITAVLFGVFAAMTACTTAESESSAEGERSERESLKYSIPSDEIMAILSEPYTFPYQECFPVDESWAFDSSVYSTSETGETEFCVWQHAMGCVPSGSWFGDFGSCGVAMTTSAAFYKYPGYKTETDASVLDDAQWQKESEWVREEIRACGCTCCHDSEFGYEDGFATAFDISAPGVWTDTFTDFGLLTATGDVDTTLLGGTFQPDVNFGFDRSHQIFPSTNPERMRAFFKGEIQRRGLSEEEIAEQIGLVPFRFAGIYSNYVEETLPCAEGEGMDADGSIYWAGDRSARYVYVLEEAAGNVGEPPGLDHPEGILWRVHLERDAEPWVSGAVVYGETPQSGTQVEPQDGAAPELEIGRSYKLYVLRDYGPRRLANCHFVYGDAVIRAR